MSNTVMLDILCRRRRCCRVARGMMWRSNIVCRVMMWIGVANGNETRCGQVKRNVIDTNMYDLRVKYSSMTRRFLIITVAVTILLHQVHRWCWFWRVWCHVSWIRGSMTDLTEVWFIYQEVGTWKLNYWNRMWCDSTFCVNCHLTLVQMTDVAFFRQFNYYFFPFCQHAQ